MPAIGGGTRGVRERYVPPQRKVPTPPAPKVYAPARPPAVFKAPLPTQPFRPAQQAVQKRVERAQLAQPKRPTPVIPKLARPTRQQSEAALAIARQHAHQSGLKPQDYWRELKNDPRQRPYLETVEHYARALNQINPKAGPNASTAKPLAPPKDVGLPLLGVAKVTIPGSGRFLQGLGHTLASVAPGLAGNTPETKFAKAFLGDVKGIGELPFVGGYKALEAGVQAAQGNTKPAGRLASGVVQGLEHGAAGELIQGHFSGAERAVREHPLFSALEALGASGVAGRTAGAVARTLGTDTAESGVGGALARAGSTVRPAVALTEDAGAARAGLVQQRTYSKDLLRKGAQVAADSRRKPVLDANGNVVTVKDRGRDVPVLQPKRASEGERLQQNRANYEAARANAVEREARTVAQKSVVEAQTKPGKGPLSVRAELRPQIKGLQPIRVRGRIAPARASTLAQHLATLVTTGTIRSTRTFKTDLESRISAIRDALENHPESFRTSQEFDAAKGNLRLLEAANRPAIISKAKGIVRQGTAQARKLNEADRQLENLQVYPAGQLERARYSEYALAHMGAQHITTGAHSGLHTPEGEFLSNAEIRQHAQQAGRNPDTLAYLPHRMAAENPRSYHRQFRPGSRPVGNEELRTGTLYNRGGTVFHPDLVKDELTSKLTTAGRVGQTDKLIRESGLRHPAVEKAAAGKTLTTAEQRIVNKGGYFTAKEGVEAAERLKADGKGEYVPLRAFAAKLPRASQEKLKGELSSASMETVHHEMFNNRFVDATDGSRTRNVVLVPAGQVTQLEKHLKPAGEVERLAQLANGPFRMAVLPQPRWLTGNFLEPFIVRLPLSGSGANIPGLALDLRAASKAVKSLDAGTAAEKQAGAEIRAMQFQGLFIGRKGASVRRTYQDFSGKTQQALYGAHVVRNLPVLKQLGDLILTVPHTFFHVNRVIESTAQRAAFGNQLRRDLHEALGSWTKATRLGDEALAEARKGLVNTPTQHRFMETQYQLLGQYEGFSPTLRRSIQGVTPFLPWTLASLRFVYWTLPAHHTTAFLAFARAGESFMAQWEKEHANTPPGTLRVAAKGSDGGYTDLARYTPFGVTQPLSELGNKGVKASVATEGLTGTLLPQISGALNALEGKDPFGRELQVKGGKPTGGQEVGIAVNQLLEGLVPGLAMARRLQEKGGTPYANSTVFSPQVKPGTSHQSAVSRTLNPFRETYLKQPTLSPTSGSASSSSPYASRLRRLREGGARTSESEVFANRLRRLREGARR